MLGEITKPMSYHKPPEKICERLKTRDSQICELQYGKKLILVGKVVHAYFQPQSPKFIRKTAVKSVESFSHMATEVLFQFLKHKQLREFLLPPSPSHLHGWVASSSLCYPQLNVTGPHLNPWMERDVIKCHFLSKECNRMTGPGVLPSILKSEVQSLDLQ